MKFVKKRIPGGKTVSQYRRKMYSRHQCALCKELLQGTPRGSKTAMHKLTKSQRRPTRPFGGQLCTKCTVKVLALKAKLKFKVISEKDIPISLRNYVQ